MNSTVKKTSLNIVTSFAGQILTIALGILIPRLFILSFGSEVNGFISSINQVFVYVALLEAGVGSASLQALYYPLAHNNRQQINRVLSATHHFYKRTGFFYLLIIIVLAFVYPLVIVSNLNYWVMCVIILIIGVGGAFPYFFNAKYMIYLRADGKEYIINLANQAKAVLLSLTKVILLLCGANVILVESVYLILGLLYCAVILIYIKKKYPWINIHEKPDNEAISQKNSVFIHQISTIIFKNTDILLLTFFCDLNTVSIYTLYKYLFSFITTAINTFSNSISFKLGQKSHDKEKLIVLHDIVDTFHTTLTFVLCAVALVFIHPFLTLYTDGMEINYILPWLPELMCIVDILDCARIPSNNLITYSGHFKQTQWRSIMESAINLCSSIALVLVWGIYGVIAGTILALVYRTNDIIIYANTKILARSPWKTYRLWLVNSIFFCIIYFGANHFSLVFTGYVPMILIAGIMALVLVPITLLVNYLINWKSGKELIGIVKEIMHRSH